MAHKRRRQHKNGRDSSTCLGNKRADGQFVPGWQHPGPSAWHPTSCRVRTLLADDTASSVTGTVRFERVGKNGKKCSVTVTF